MMEMNLLYLNQKCSIMPKRYFVLPETEEYCEEVKCPRCKQKTIYVETVEDSEGHEDYHYRCHNFHCMESWWVDGSDY